MVSLKSCSPSPLSCDSKLGKEKISRNQPLHREAEGSYMEKCVAPTDIGCPKLDVDQHSEISAGCSSLEARVTGFAFCFIG